MSEIESSPLYLNNLIDEVEAYGNSLLLNVVNGFRESLYISPTQLYKSEYTRSYPLAKASKGILHSFSQYQDKLKGILGAKGKRDPKAPFKIKGKQIYRQGKPLNMREWAQFEKEVTEYMRPYMSDLTEELAVKATLLAFAAAQAEAQGKRDSFDEKSYAEVQRDTFKGFIPESKKSLEDRFNLVRGQQKALNFAQAQAAKYVTNLDEMAREAIKAQILHASQYNLSPRDLASNLYWSSKDRPALEDKTLAGLQRNWRRIADTETAFIYEASKLGATEGQAEQSVDNPEKAVYVVFTGGTCDFCAPNEGTIMRQVPMDLVKDQQSESLSAFGIEDPYTNVATWVGKNNVGLPKARWMRATPAHPNGRARQVRFYPDFQKWDKQTRTAESKTRKEFDKYLSNDILREYEDTKAAADKARQKWRDQAQAKRLGS